MAWAWGSPSLKRSRVFIEEQSSYRASQDADLFSPWFCRERNRSSLGRLLEIIDKKFRNAAEQQRQRSWVRNAFRLAGKDNDFGILSDIGQCTP